MLRVSREVVQVNCFLPLVGRVAYIPKVFSYGMRVAIPPLLDHGVLRSFLIEHCKAKEAETKILIEGEDVPIPF